MIKTKIKKAILVVGFLTIGTLSLGKVFATQIGTGSVTGDSSFDTPINWDDTYGNLANASGSITDILIKATVEPALNMEISTGVLDLGVLTPGEEASASLNIEVGTNAADGVSITARSQSGGLTNLSDNTIQINNLTSDGVAESYKFTSQTGATADSTVSGFSQDASLDEEVNDNTTEHLVYTSNKPQQKDQLDDVVFTVKSTIDAQTQAGEYEDHITFTVTGNF